METLIVMSDETTLRAMVWMSVNGARPTLRRSTEGPWCCSWYRRGQLYRREADTIDGAVAAALSASPGGRAGVPGRDDGRREEVAMLSPEEFEEFVGLVERLRRARRRYYAGEKGLLGLCRQLEDAVDGALEAHANPSLFDRRPGGGGPALTKAPAELLDVLGEMADRGSALASCPRCRRLVFVTLADRRSRAADRARPRGPGRGCISSVRSAGPGCRPWSPRRSAPSGSGTGPTSSTASRSGTNARATIC